MTCAHADEPEMPLADVTAVRPSSVEAFGSVKTTPRTTPPEEVIYERKPGSRDESAAADCTEGSGVMDEMRNRWAEAWRKALRAAAAKPAALNRTHGDSDSIAASLSSFSKPLSVRVRLRTPTRFCRLPATYTTSEVVSRGK